MGTGPSLSCPHKGVGCPQRGRATAAAPGSVTLENGSVAPQAQLLAPEGVGPATTVKKHL